MPLESRHFEADLSVMDLIFVGFNSRVAALHRDTGEIVWDWEAPKGSGFPTVLLDGDRLIVSVQGYTFCLDPLTGEQFWWNPLKGFGIGTASLTSIHGSSGSAAVAAIIAQQQAAASSATGNPAIQ